MKIIECTTRISKEEHEVCLLYDLIDDKWYMDTTIPRVWRRALKCGWKQTKEYRYKDGTVCGMAFEAPEWAVLIRNVIKRTVKGGIADNFRKTSNTEEDEEE